MKNEIKVLTKENYLHFSLLLLIVAALFYLYQYFGPTCVWDYTGPESFCMTFWSASTLFLAGLMWVWAGFTLIINYKDFKEKMATSVSAAKKVLASKKVVSRKKKK